MAQGDEVSVGSLGIRCKGNTGDQGMGGDLGGGRLWGGARGCSQAPRALGKQRKPGEGREAEMAAAGALRFPPSPSPSPGTRARAIYRAGGLGGVLPLHPIPTACHAGSSPCKGGGGDVPSHVP